MTARQNKQTGGRAAFRFSPRPNRASEINWHEWGDEPFRLALKQQKPVLLAISAVWCHWCHVMDETGYSDDEVIALINRSFIPVRVDTDRRPDINARYNNGGWPTIAFLTPGAESIAGSTYLPPGELQQLLKEVSRLYDKSALEIEAAVQQVKKQRAEKLMPPAGELGHAIADHVLKVAGELYDSEHGGFGAEAKFPHAGVLALMVASLAGGGDDGLEKMLNTTLDAMSGGGMYDPVEGGFFRYATSPDWSSPHFEKMLEDNAALLSVYADAFLVTGDKKYEKTVRGIHSYLKSILLDPETGAFGGSQDADGEYYALDEEARSKRDAPHVDRTVYSGWNAQAASALLRAFQVFGDEEYRSQALGALDFVWGRMWGQQAGPYHYHDGEPRLPGLLADAASLLHACLDACETGAGDTWLDRALGVARWMLANLQDEEMGGFYDGAVAPGDDGLACERVKPPVENGTAASALIRLAQTTGQPRFSDAAGRALSFFAGTYSQHGLFAAEYALAVKRLLDPPVRVTVAGPPGEDSTVEMVRAAHRARVPFRSVEVLDPRIHGEELKAAGYGYEGQPVAYVCVGASCQPPVFSAGDLSDRLEMAWKAVSGR